MPVRGMKTNSASPCSQDVTRSGSVSATVTFEGTATRGIALMIAATMVFSVQDVLTKQLVQTHAAQQVLWVRYLFFAAFALMISARKRPLRVAFRSARPLFQIIRSLLIATTMGLFALAVRVLPLADAHALVASAPLMVTVLSAVCLPNASEYAAGPPYVSGSSACS